MAQKNDYEGEAPLSMYLAYEYLPLGQQAKILEAIDGVYKTILRDKLDSWYWMDRVLLSRRQYPIYHPGADDFFGPHLCIVSAHTGNSINFKFDHERKVFPRFAASGDDIDVYIPPWTAAVLLTGAVLNGGLNAYGEYLDIKQKHIDIERSQLELDRLKDESTPEHNQIQVHLNQFKYEINQQNITEVKINDVSPRSSGKDTSRQR